MNMEGIAFKPQAYIKVALNLENLKEDVGEIYKKDGLNGLQKIPGVGKGLAEAIEEYLKKGKIKTLEDYKKKSPIKLEELLKVEVPAVNETFKISSSAVEVAPDAA